MEDLIEEGYDEDVEQSILISVPVVKEPEEEKKASTANAQS